MIYLFVKQLIRLMKVKFEINYESRKEGAEIFNCEIDLLAVLAFPCFVINAVPDYYWTRLISGKKWYFRGIISWKFVI